MATEEVRLAYDSAAGRSAPGVVAVRGVAIAILAGSIGLFILREGAGLFVPILLGVLLSYVLEPPLGVLARAGVPRVVAAGILYVVIGLSIGAAARSTRDQVTSFLDDWPETVASMKRLVEDKDPEDSRLFDRLQKEARALHATLLRHAPPPEPGVVRVMPVTRFKIDEYLQHLGHNA